MQMGASRQPAFNKRIHTGREGQKDTEISMRNWKIVEPTDKHYARVSLSGRKVILVASVVPAEGMPDELSEKEKNFIRAVMSKRDRDIHAIVLTDFEEQGREEQEVAAWFNKLESRPEFRTWVAGTGAP
jgi:hypothetical protein